MSKLKSKKIVDQINNLTAFMIEVGLTEEEEFAHINKKRDCILVDINSENDTNIFLKDYIPYEEMYGDLYRNKSYNFRMIDGALVRFQYTVDITDEYLLKSRLSFFPSPTLFAYDEDAEMYKTDQIYSDIISENIFPTAIRFDFDLENTIEIHHPSSHLTLGQYKNCRIPVTSPLTPFQFCDFLIRNFYNKIYREKIIDEKKFNDLDSFKFDNTILSGEKEIRHLQVY